MYILMPDFYAQLFWCNLFISLQVVSLIVFFIRIFLHKNSLNIWWSELFVCAEKDSHSVVVDPIYISMVAGQGLTNHTVTGGEK